MRKRLRKKKHLSEFQEFGFPLKIVMHDGIVERDEDTLYEMFDALVALCRQYKWMVGGGIPDKLVVSERRARTMNASLQQDFCEKVSVLPGVRYCVDGPLVDSWHGTDEEYQAAEDIAELKAKQHG